jgi:superfamily I DNA and RNA helicase
MKLNLKNKLSSALKSKAPAIYSKAIETEKTSKSTAEVVNHHLRSKELRESASKTSIDSHIEDKIVNFDYSQQKID